MKSTPSLLRLQEPLCEIFRRRLLPTRGLLHGVAFIAHDSCAIGHQILHIVLRNTAAESQLLGNVVGIV